MDQARTTALSQYPTPAWAAAALVRAHLPDLHAGDLVLDPTCGPGRFLEAVPCHVPAIGVELCPNLAQAAREATRRPVITGDFLMVDLPERPTVVLGNPPFETALIERVLERCHSLLDEGGRCLFILPAYFFQTAARVVRYNEQWSMAQECLPRNLYHGLKHPLVFATFTKDQHRVMVGFSLYHELRYLQSMPKSVQQAMVSGPSTWRSIIEEAFNLFGGEAELADIYEYVADRRPSVNRHWKEQVRKVCQQTARRVSRGRYASLRSVSQNA